ncbi:MAG TPA: DM13 domain-containing protein [Puia sp.]|nr:DM13 domain-containing protein [Puia sp.]
MKNLFLLTLLMFVFASCTKQNSSETPSDNHIDSIASQLKYSGVFQIGAEGTVMGKANIYLSGSKYQLELDSFSVSNGPDLHVYLAQDIQGIHFIELGKLKSTNGNDVYDIPGLPDFTTYKYALIYCQQYSVLFGSAELK